MTTSSWKKRRARTPQDARNKHAECYRTRHRRNKITYMGQQAFTGGLRTAGFNATWPFARLTVTDDNMTLRLFGLIHTRRDWATVQSAQRIVGGILGSPGVRITLADGRRIVFWTFSPEAVLAAFQAHGVSATDEQGRPPKVWLGT